MTPGALIVQVKPDYTAAMDVHSSGLRYRRPFGQVPNAGVYDIVDGKHWRQKQKEMQRNPGACVPMRVPACLLPAGSRASSSCRRAAECQGPAVCRGAC